MISSASMLHPSQMGTFTRKRLGAARRASILELLRANPDGLTVTQIGQRPGITTSNIYTAHLPRLIACGAVERFDGGIVGLRS